MLKIFSQHEKFTPWHVTNFEYKVIIISCNLCMSRGGTQHFVNANIEIFFLAREGLKVTGGIYTEHSDLHILSRQFRMTI